LREERRLWVFESRVLRKIFGPKRDEVTGERRKLHNEEVLLTQYCAGGKIEKNEMGRPCGTYGGEERLYRVLEGKLEGKRPLGISRPRWEDNIKMDLQEVGGGCMDWIELTQDRDRWRAFASAVTNLRVS
jgi:hypothetical protein